MKEGGEKFTVETKRLLLTSLNEMIKEQRVSVKPGTHPEHPGTPRNTPEHPGTPPEHHWNSPEQPGTARNNPGTPLEHPIIPRNIP